ncbi:FkbM family methyltransferase [Rhizobium jaguaris]|uniref:FkbM family methyltransferase n=1 Tax=Rhizobium jaguaris TaxID=1312183 RepID=UPI001FE1A518|nr:FkbM family methyltransferase [Rhizobium jaguaris]
MSDVSEHNAPSVRLPVEGDVDLVVRDSFFADPDYRGIVVEVGGAKPDYLSISASFRRAGWQSLAIEPNPKFCELHRQQGSEVLELACGETDQDDVPFFVVESSSTYLGENVTNESFSSLGIRGRFADLMGTVSATTTEIKVQVRRLDTIFAERGIDQSAVDILCIDVEGWELEVLSGLSDQKIGPRILIIENLFGEDRYQTNIASRGYVLWKTIEPNEIYVRSDIVESNNQA